VKSAVLQVECQGESESQVNRHSLFLIYPRAEGFETGSKELGGNNS
jgi:hypothetical protein